jgi:hypothetical protein
MTINFENGKLVSKHVMFEGTTPDGKEFVINANWNDWDDWNVLPDDISFVNEDGTDEDFEQIIEIFSNEMNG